MDDTRGRIPFALLGVLLLVSSLTLAPTFVGDPVPTDTAVERALDRATAETQSAVRSGVATAGRRAAANPVVTPADTPAGRVLNESTPFRDALRIRTYLRVRERLKEVSHRSGDVTVSASLPQVSNASDLRSAKRRVSVARAGANETAMRATVDDVLLTVRRHGRVVAERRVSPTVVVPTPALMLHDQASTYQTKLNASLAHPGLSQRLTARLYPIAYARGYAQYGGAGIENVVANRHVSLAANGALLGVQRSTFGRSDPAGRRALTEATAMTGVEDLVRGSNGSALAGEVLNHAEYRPVSETPVRQHSPGRPGAGDSMTVGVNDTSDTVFRTVAAPDALNETLADAYTVEVALETERERVGGGRPAKPPSPGANWTLVSQRTTMSVDAVENDTGSVSPPDGWHALDSFGRVVERRYRRTAVWENAGMRRRTAATSTARYHVAVTVVGRHRDRSPAPNRSIATAHDASASPLGGPNLADVAGKAQTRLVGSAGGRDRIAERVVSGALERTNGTVTADRPPGLSAWVYRDLMGLRERVRGTNVTVERGKVGTFEANPPKRLRNRLRARRDGLADVPATYDSAAQKARVAARLAYLDAVDTELSRQAAGRAESERSVRDRVAAETEGSLRELRRGLTARETRVARSRPVPVGPSGPVRTRVDARTPYLPLAELDERRYRALNGSEHPLVARNVNVFTVPYGDAAEAVIGSVPGPSHRVRLSSAATTLAAANATLHNESNATLAAKRKRLRAQVRRSNAELATAMRRTVAAETGAASDSGIVADALSRWDSPAARALALTNGSAPDQVARLAGQRRNLTRTERDWLRLQLRAAISAPETVPTAAAANGTATAARNVAHGQATQALADAGRSKLEQRVNESIDVDGLPAGLPLGPPWTARFATVNIWWVTVRGEYARFAVTASHGPPTEPGAQTTYARDGSEVTLDVDGDGTAETLGTADRISFRADTGVVVVVPPKPRGVGDKDGTAVEESGGWPTAGD
ncbi:DUF7286 family protein [Haloarcula salina]|uniref:DUF7286 family protein n=1 Tax=Haloarcula salina TaxID=1429914 RepID=UPI003C704A32